MAENTDNIQSSFLNPAPAKKEKAVEKKEPYKDLFKDIDSKIKTTSQDVDNLKSKITSLKDLLKFDGDLKIPINKDNSVDIPLPKHLVPNEKERQDSVIGNIPNYSVDEKGKEIDNSVSNKDLFDLLITVLGKVEAIEEDIATIKDDIENADSGSGVTLPSFDF